MFSNRVLTMQQGLGFQLCALAPGCEATRHTKKKNYTQSSPTAWEALVARETCVIVLP